MGWEDEGFKSSANAFLTCSRIGGCSLTYEVIYYCHVLPAWKTEASGLTLVQAESKLQELENKKKGDTSKMDCCRYFIQPEN